MSANTAKSTIHPFGVDKWVVSWTQAFAMRICVVEPPGECLQVKTDMVLSAGNTVWSISKRVRGICVDALYKLTYFTFQSFIITCQSINKRQSFIISCQSFIIYKSFTITCQSFITTCQPFIIIPCQLLLLLITTYHPSINTHIHRQLQTWLVAEQTLYIQVDTQTYSVCLVHKLQLVDWSISLTPCLHMHTNHRWLGAHPIHNCWSHVWIMAMALSSYFWDRWPSLWGELSLDVTTTRINSALHPIPPRSRNRVPASAGVKVVKSLLLGGR